MPAKKSVAGNGAAPKRTRESVDMSAVTGKGVEAEWPGQSRNATASALRIQLTDEVEGMEMGSVRRYEVEGSKQQTAFLALFRSIVNNVHGENTYGVRAVRQDGVVFVKLDEPITRTRKAKV